MAAAVEPHTMSTSSANAVAGPSRGQTIQAAFEVYREEIDAHNDRRERLIKASRDVTGLSKKLIFLLHRFPTPAHLSSSSSSSQGQAPPPQPQRSKLHQEAQTKIDDIVAVINRVAFEEHLSRGSGESERYERNFGSGVEEFIEAISFHHFLLYGTLISHDEVQDLFRIDPNNAAKSTYSGPDGLPVTIPADFMYPVPIHRYLLGISDLTGELMRFATNALGGGGGGKGSNGSSGAPSDPSAVVRAVLHLLREIREGLEPFCFLVQDMRKKQAVTTQSLRKIEDLSYQLSVRISEFGGDETVIKEMLRRALEGGSGSGGTGNGNLERGNGEGED